MKKTGFIYGDIFLKHTAPTGHPETEKRLVSIMQSVKNSDILDKIQIIEPAPAELSDIETVHTSSYIQEIKTADAGYLNPDTYFTEHTFNIALHAAGGVIKAVCS